MVSPSSSTAFYNSLLGLGAGATFIVTYLTTSFLTGAFSTGGVASSFLTGSSSSDDSSTTEISSFS